MDVFNDEVFLGLIERENPIPIHYLHEDHQGDDAVTAYWRRHLGGRLRTGTGNRTTGGFRQSYPPRNQQNPYQWPAGQQAIIRKQGNRVAGHGL